jgi:hypothetical protein
MMFEFELRESLSLVMFTDQMVEMYNLSPRIEFYTESTRLPYATPTIATAIGRRPAVQYFFSDSMVEVMRKWFTPTSSATRTQNWHFTDDIASLLHTSRDLAIPGSEARPKRLLDIGICGYDSELGVELIETTGSPGSYLYVTLSHCWVGRPILTSTAFTLAERMSGIGWQDLPPVFKDAVKVCRFIGIQYLWIDSLCILQGDVVDWEREASRMDDIYENALFTICVQDDDADGFILKPKYHKIRDVTPETAAIYARELPLPPFLNPTGIFIKDKDDLNPSQVYARGWCYQEHYLSRRMLHFTKDEVIYESADGIQCQCGYHSGSSNLKHYSSRTDSVTAVQQWSIAVKGYSQRALTQKWDLLPGIAGIARRFSRDHHNHLGSYVAGLWSKDLVRWLCWKSWPQYTTHAMRSFCENCRIWPVRLPRSPHPDNIIPSFSWASRSGTCKFPKFVWYGSYHQRAEILKLKYRSNADAPFGRVLKAQIILKAPCKRAFVYSTAHREHGNQECLREYVYVFDQELHQQVRRSNNSEDPSHWFQLRTEPGAFEISHDASDDIPTDSTEILLMLLLEGNRYTAGDGAFDHEPPVNNSGVDISTQMPDVATDATALVLLKTGQEGGQGFLGRRSIDVFRRIGIVFFNSPMGFSDSATVMLR